MQTQNISEVDKQKSSADQIARGCQRRRGRKLRYWLAAPVGMVLMLLGACSMVSMPGRSYSGQKPEMIGALGQSAERMKGHVMHLSETLSHRSLKMPEELEAAAQYIEDELGQPGLVVTSQRYDCDGQTVRNVIAELPGTSKADEIVVIGAHYDSAHGLPGADDNASGTAGVLELARMFAAAGPPARTIRFVAFTNEEPPYYKTAQMGSLVYAKACAQRGEKIVAMYSLEMLGYYSDTPGSQRLFFPFSMWYPDTGNYIVIIGRWGTRGFVRRTVGAFRASGRIPSEGAAVPTLVHHVTMSDQWSFWQAGYKNALMVTDTAFMRNRHYHTPLDTWEKLDYDRMALVVEGLFGAFRAEANR